MSSYDHWKSSDPALEELGDAGQRDHRIDELEAEIARLNALVHRLLEAAK